MFKSSKKPYQTVILGIESSCDDTSAAIIADGVKLANVTATQEVHKKYGGVVPELASRAHQQHIVPVVHSALQEAGIGVEAIDAISFTNGPGLLGSLLVGSSFAKGLSLALNKPLIEVNHMHGHILAHFIQEVGEAQGVPQFPFLCLTVSGGHTQLVKVKDHLSFGLLGQTKDDAAGEAFDKIAKIMDLPYPGGPVLDKLAQKGNPKAFQFPKSNVKGLDFSFSGLKTAVLYFLKKQLAEDPNFIENNKADLAASVQYTIVQTLMKKAELALKSDQFKGFAVSGGVSANSGLREAISQLGRKRKIPTYIPPFEYCTDNAAMIAITGYYHYLDGNFSSGNSTPNARMKLTL